MKFRFENGEYSLMADLHAKSRLQKDLSRASGFEWICRDANQTSSGVVTITSLSFNKGRIFSTTASI
jgi:uncharacterized phage protein gp47/JayE